MVSEISRRYKRADVVGQESLKKQISQQSSGDHSDGSVQYYQAVLRQKEYVFKLHLCISY